MPNPCLFGDTEIFPQIHLLHLEICGPSSLPRLLEDGSNTDFPPAPFIIPKERSQLEHPLREVGIQLEKDSDLSQNQSSLETFRGLPVLTRSVTTTPKVKSGYLSQERGVWRAPPALNCSYIKEGPSQSPFLQSEREDSHIYDVSTSNEKREIRPR